MLYFTSSLVCFRLAGRLSRHAVSGTALSRSQAGHTETVSARNRHETRSVDNHLVKKKKKKLKEENNGIR